MVYGISTLPGGAPHNKMNEHTNDVCFMALIISDKFIEFEKSTE